MWCFGKGRNQEPAFRSLEMQEGKQGKENRHEGILYASKCFLKDRLPQVLDPWDDRHQGKTYVYVWKEGDALSAFASVSLWLVALGWSVQFKIQPELGFGCSSPATYELWFRRPLERAPNPQQQIGDSEREKVVLELEQELVIYLTDEQLVAVHRKTQRGCIFFFAVCILVLVVCILTGIRF